MSGYAIRPAGSSGDDVRFLERMVCMAARWRTEELDDGPLSDPAVRRYVERWGRAGDTALIVEDEAGGRLGAAWYRLFSARAPGFGFVDEDVPELAVAVDPRSRGRGLGTALLEALVKRARSESFPGISLSVEDGNPSARLYASMGFADVRHEGNATTMLLRFR